MVCPDCQVAADEPVEGRRQAWQGDGLLLSPMRSSLTADPCTCVGRRCLARPPSQVKMRLRRTGRDEKRWRHSFKCHTGRGKRPNSVSIYVPTRGGARRLFVCVLAGPQISPLWWVVVSLLLQEAEFVVRVSPDRGPSLGSSSPEMGAMVLTSPPSQPHALHS